MNKYTCQICHGAIPDGAELSSHTSLCAEVVRRGRLRSQVMEFHRVFGQAIGSKPEVPSAAVCVLRARLVAEEFCEWLESMYGANMVYEVRRALRRLVDEQDYDAHLRTRVDMPQFVDALADMDYVIEGTRLAFGVDGGPIAAAVHAANMAKLGPDGKPIVRKDGKLLKPPGWSPPDIEGELRRQGWKP